MSKNVFILYVLSLLLILPISAMEEVQTNYSLNNRLSELRAKQVINFLERNYENFKTLPEDQKHEIWDRFEYANTALGIGPTIELPANIILPTDIENEIKRLLKKGTEPSFNATPQINAQLFSESNKRSSNDPAEQLSIRLFERKTPIDHTLQGN